MNLAQIRLRVSGGGFRPFELHTSDGRAYLVEHPENLLLAPRSLAVLTDDGLIATLDPLHIVAIKDIRPRKNGAAKK